MGGIELCLQCRGNSLAWQLYRGGGGEEEEEEEREGEGGKNQ